MSTAHKELIPVNTHLSEHGKGPAPETQTFPQIISNPEAAEDSGWDLSIGPTVRTSGSLKITSRFRSGALRWNNPWLLSHETRQRDPGKDLRDVLKTQRNDSSPFLHLPPISS